MDNLQGKIWDILTDKDRMTSRDVARSFTDHFGIHLLDESFARYLIKQGFADEWELGLDSNNVNYWSEQD